MSLADKVYLPPAAKPARRDAVAHPKGYEPGFEWDCGSPG